MSDKGLSAAKAGQLLRKIMDNDKAYPISLPMTGYSTVELKKMK